MKIKKIIGGLMLFIGFTMIWILVGIELNGMLNGIKGMIFACCVGIAGTIFIAGGFILDAD